MVRTLSPTVKLDIIFSFLTRVTEKEAQSFGRAQQRDNIFVSLCLCKFPQPLLPFTIPLPFGSGNLIYLLLRIFLSLRFGSCTLPWFFFVLLVIYAPLGFSNADVLRWFMVEVTLPPSVVHTKSQYIYI